MRTGFTALSIVPKEETLLAGYAPYRMATGVHDEIYVRALIWESEEPIVMIQFDLLVIEELLKQAIDDRLTKHGYAADHILVSATHTHSSLAHIMDTDREPLNEQTCGLLSMDRIHALADACEQAFLQAQTTMQETSIKTAQTQYAGLGSNRTDARLSGDQQLVIMELNRADQTKLLIYSIGCHATVMNQANTLISGDFAGCVNEQLKHHYAMVMFLNGPAGDMSTRFIRKESSFAECERLAAGLIHAIADALTNRPSTPLTSVSIEPFNLSLPANRPLPLAIAKANFDAAQKELDAKIGANAPEGEIRLAKEKQTGARFRLIEAENQSQAAKVEDHINVSCSLLHVQGQDILFTPFELYSKLSLQIKAKAPIWIIGYTNQALCYLPNKEAYDQNDYEACLSLFEQGAGEQFVDAVLARLNA